MVHQVSVLKNFKKHAKRVIKETGSNLKVGYDDCKHTLCMSHKAYCALRREKIDGEVCKGCEHFDPEPLEYRLFRRM